MLAASEFEFKQRFWMIGAIFGLAFLSHNLDPRNAGAAVTEGIARLGGTTATRGDYHLTFAIAALFTVAAALVRPWATACLNPEVCASLPGTNFAPRCGRSSGGVPNWADGLLGEVLAVINRRGKSRGTGAEENTAEGPEKNVG